MRRLIVAFLLLSTLTACSSSGNGAATPGKPDQLVVLPRDLPAWGHEPTDELAHGTLMPSITQCFEGKTLPAPSVVGESFTHSNDTIRSRSYVYESPEAANAILEIRRGQPFRDCVKAAIEAKGSTTSAEVAALPMQNSAGVSAIEIKHLGKHPLKPKETFLASLTYVVTVTQGNSETVIEASHDPSAGGVDGAEIKTIERLANKIKDR